MTRVLHRPKRDEALLLAACTTSAPAVRTAPIATTLRPEPGISAEVLFDLRADDARDTSFAAARALLAMPMRDPAKDPQPITALLDRARHVMRSRDAAFEALLTEDQARREQAAYDTWASDTDAELLAECCADIAAAVAARPELRHNTALLMAMAPVVAMLKGSVA